VTNYRDLLHEAFAQDLADEVTWSLMPLGTRAPIGPLEYLSGARPHGAVRSHAVDEFLAEIQTAAAALETEGIDTGRLLTIFDIALQSTKKVEQADIVIGVDREAAGESVLVTRVLDPNRSHPYRRKDLLERIGDEGGAPFNSYSFEAVVWHHGLKDKPHLCWVDESTRLTKWSPEVVAIVKRLGPEEVEEARIAYSAYQRRRSRSRT
jgi:hypothetical protein